MNDCNLSKPCGYCKKPYGRKTKVDGKGYEYLQAVVSFERSTYCSDECKSKGLGLENTRRAAERKIEAERIEQARTGAENLFLYAGKFNHEMTIK